MRKTVYMITNVGGSENGPEIILWERNYFYGAHLIVVRACFKMYLWLTFLSVLDLSWWSSWRFDISFKYPLTWHIKHTSLYFKYARFIRVFIFCERCIRVILLVWKLLEPALDATMQQSEELSSVPTKLEFNVASLENYLKTRLPNILSASIDSPQITVQFFKYCSIKWPFHL